MSEETNPTNDAQTEPEHVRWMKEIDKRDNQIAILRQMVEMFNAEKAYLEARSKNLVMCSGCKEAFVMLGIADHIENCKLHSSYDLKRQLSEAHANVDYYSQKYDEMQVQFAKSVDTSRKWREKYLAQLPSGMEDRREKAAHEVGKAVAEVANKVIPDVDPRLVDNVPLADVQDGTRDGV